METKDVLKALRKSNGFITMQDFCKASGISFSTYQNYEAGKRIPTADMLIKLADFYGVTTDYLLGREPAPDPFADLNLNKESEKDVIDKYMSLPPNIRLQLADAAKQRQNAPSEEDTQCSKLSVSTALGTIEDEIEKMAMAKGGV